MDRTNKQIESQLIAAAHDFLAEMHAERARLAITLDASLEHDLGIDSLGRVELFHRVERLLSIHLPENAMADVKSLRDLVRIIEQAIPVASVKTHDRKPASAATQPAFDLSACETLIDALSIYAANDPDRHHIYLRDEFGEEVMLCYGKLMAEAESVARGLLNRGIQPGESIAIMLPTCEEFFYAFTGILLAGAVAVPIYPPIRPDLIEEYIKRQAKILNNAQARILITFSRVEMLSGIFQTFIPSLKEVTTLRNLQSASGSLPDMRAGAQDIAFIQYTSGSTGDPKGVVLTHKNIIANIRAIGNAVNVQPTDVNVSWLPLYHDMGLMSWLASLYYGVPLAIMSPLIFLSRPEKWLWAIHYHRGTFSGGPNFAYESCVKNIKPEDVEGLDLSSWRFAYDGSEAVNPGTIASFSKKFAAYGFKTEAFAPAYGLAETTVALTIPTKKRPPRIDRVKRDALENENKAVPSESDRVKEILEFVACGEVIAGHELRIVDEAGNVLENRRVGNIQFKGPSAMQGYYNNPVLTQNAYHDGWWETGDLGYVADGDLFITGRKKDIIIKAGRHLFPEEIEDIVNQTASIRKGGVAAFGVNDIQAGTEKLVVVAETEITDKKSQQEISAEIINKLSLILGMPPDAIILVPPDTVPKTYSGKLQRSACRKAYIEGRLVRHKLPVRLQLARLVLAGAGKRVLNWLGRLGRVIYAAYVGLIICLTFPFIWLGALILPSRPVAVILRIWARTILRLALCPVRIEGKTNLQAHAPLIFVSNHASYVDALLMLGILPAGVSFTPKMELLRNPVLRPFIKKLHYLPIDRMDFSRSIEDKTRIEEAIQAGFSIAMFPEGTFSYATGLRPFKSGAFAIAVETQTPICPVAVKGTRSILRGDSLLPKPGLITVSVGKPVRPEGKGWDEITRLHTLVRAEIAKHCGEPVMDIIVAEPAKD